MARVDSWRNADPRIVSDSASCARPVVIRIEMDRGNGWEVRQQGELDQDRAAIIATIEATLPAYCDCYRHRAWVDGVIVATAEPAR